MASSKRIQKLIVRIYFVEKLGLRENMRNLQSSNEEERILKHMGIPWKRE